MGAIVPEEFGGAGLSFFDAFIILESAGRGVVPAPLLGTAIMGPVALLEAGSDAQKNEWLPQMAAGECKVGIAMTEIVNEREEAGVNLSDGKLNGKALFVIDAGMADLYVVAAGGDSLALVKADAAGLTRIILPTVDKTRCVAELQFDNVEADLLGAAGSAGAAIARVMDAGRIALAADSLGAGEVMIDKAVEYAKERQQFNRAIGSFQAVKHMCADMVADLEPARSLIWYAAHSFDFVPEESRLMACHAKAHISEVATQVAKASVEVHGGMGFTDLLGLHFWFKRIGLNRQLLGSPEQLRNDAAIAQGWIAA